MDCVKDFMDQKCVSMEMGADKGSGKKYMLCRLHPTWDKDWKKKSRILYN